MSYPVMQIQANFYYPAKFSFTYFACLMLHYIIFSSAGLANSIAG